MNPNPMMTMYIDWAQNWAISDPQYDLQTHLSFNNLLQNEGDMKKLFKRVRNENINNINQDDNFDAALFTLDSFMGGDLLDNNIQIETFTQADMSQAIQALPGSQRAAIKYLIPSELQPERQTVVRPRRRK